MYLRKTLPIIISYLLLGTTFGVLFAEKGGDAFSSFLISLTTFAGAAQFLALEYLDTNYGLIEFFVAIFILNLRHIGYGIALFDKLGRWDLKKIYLIYALTDENFGIFQITDIKSRKNTVIIFIVNHIAWIAGCVIGSLAGKSLYIPGADFALTALFIVLLIESVKKIKISIWKKGF